MHIRCVATVAGLFLLSGACGSVDDEARDAGTAADAGEVRVDDPDGGDGGDGGETTEASYLLGLALGDEIDRRVPRGWPLLLTQVAARTGADAVLLDASSLEFSIEDADGARVSWPLERLTALPASSILDDANEQLEVVWALTAAQTSALPLGRYVARLSWAGRRAAPLEFEVVEPGPDTPLSVRRRASLEARAALLRDDARRALEVVDAALVEQPRDATLLVWRAKALAASGALADALVAIDAAVERALADDPAGSEPPVTVFENRRVIEARVIGGGP